MELGEVPAHQYLAVRLDRQRIDDSVRVGVETVARGGCGLSLERHAGCSQQRKTDRKSTRLNSSHLGISYAVFCLKKRKETKQRFTPIGWLSYSTHGTSLFSLL